MWIKYTGSTDGNGLTVGNHYNPAIKQMYIVTEPISPGSPNLIVFWGMPDEFNQLWDALHESTGSDPGLAPKPGPIEFTPNQGILVRDVGMLLAVALHAAAATEQVALVEGIPDE
jgi:hypothetical protein